MCHELFGDATGSVAKKQAKSLISVEQPYLGYLSVYSLKFLNVFESQ